MVHVRLKNIIDIQRYYDYKILLKYTSTFYTIEKEYKVSNNKMLFSNDIMISRMTDD